MKAARQGILLCLIGPAGSGKTTFTNQLLTEYEPSGSLRRSISVTSRTPRQGEREGIDYFFVSREEFLSRVQQQVFFEWEETHGNYYGTERKPLEESLTSGADIILDIDIRGAMTFKKHFALHTVVAFVVPPSTAELQERLEKRGTSQEDVERRLVSALREYDAFWKVKESIDYFVVNDSQQEAFEQVRSILLAERVKLARIRGDDLQNVLKAQ